MGVDTLHNVSTKDTSKIKRSNFSKICLLLIVHCKIDFREFSCTSAFNLGNDLRVECL